MGNMMSRCQPLGYAKHNPFPAMLADYNEAIELIRSDELLFRERYLSLDGSERQELFGLYVFLYRFFQSHEWGRVDRKINGYCNFVELESPTPGDRIALVDLMTGQDERLVRLSQISSADGDEDMIELGKSQQFREYVLRLVRFFSLTSSFGFKKDMSDVVHTLTEQQWSNCYLCAACDLIDLQVQRDVSGADKFKRMDKAQVARRVMSGKQLFNYVVNDDGDTVIKFFEKVLGSPQSSSLAIYRNDDLSFKKAEDIEFNLRRALELAGPVFVGFDAKKLSSYSCEKGIPLFDSFERDPVGYLELNDVVPDEEELLKKQMLPETKFSAGRTRSVETIPALRTASTLTSVASFDEGNDKESASVKTASAEDEHDVDYTGRHSAICMGGFDLKDNKKYFLMRNSWDKLPLFCASAQCFASANLMAIAIKRPLTEIPCALDLSSRRYSTCASPHVTKEGKPAERSIPENFVAGSKYGAGP